MGSIEIHRAPGTAGRARTACRSVGALFSALVLAGCGGGTGNADGTGAAAGFSSDTTGSVAGGYTATGTTATDAPSVASPSPGTGEALRAPQQRPTLAMARRAPLEPVTFFRAQQAGCRIHARQSGSPQVESARFLNAHLVRPLGGGAYLISDGLGTRLFVRPAAGLVLPGSGNDADEMPAPYAAGCPPEVFVGSAG
jgi:hypothetical protein